MAIFWAMLEKAVPFALNFCFSIILARLVAPEAYGLVAMTAIFLAVGGSLQNLGLGAALVQIEKLSEDDTTTVFGVNVGMSFILAVALATCAPMIAAFYDRQDLVTIIYANSVVLIITGLRLVHMSLLQRRFEFRVGFVVDSTSTAIAGAAAIGLAMRGQGVWALVGLVLVRETCQTVLIWWLIGWRPSGHYSGESLRRLWAFSSHMVAASFFHHVATNLASVLIGKGYAATDLGYFARAQSLQNMPVGLVAGPVQRIAFPAYCRKQSDRNALRNALRSHQRMVALFAAFIGATLAVGSREIVIILFGKNWLPSAQMLEFLALATPFMLLVPLHSEANKAIGESLWFMRIEFAKKSCLVIAVAIGFVFGIKGVLIALVATSIVDYILSAASSARFLKYDWLLQLQDSLSAIILGVIGAGLTVAFKGLLAGIPTVAALAIKVGVIASVFGLAIVGAGNRIAPELVAGARRAMLRRVPS